MTTTRGVIISVLAFLATSAAILVESAVASAAPFA